MEDSPGAAHHIRLREIGAQILSIDDSIQVLRAQKASLLEEQSLLQDELLSQTLDPGQDWNKESFPWSLSLRQGLKDIFGFSEFRSQQLPAMNALLSKRDLLLVLPTSGGKSLTYQLPALGSFGVWKGGFAIVVSPLISLMEDQVNALRSLPLEGSSVHILNSFTPKPTVDDIHKDMTSETASLRLIYITPERLKKSKRFLNKLQKAHSLGLFRFLAIDEVHCCSQWGHDFRPDYMFLNIMKETFPGVPIMGLTATLTRSVLKEVREILHIPDCLVFKASLDRPNIRYRVMLKSSSGDVELLRRLLCVDFKGQCGIVYVLTIKQAETLWKELRSSVRVGIYHGSMESEDRRSMHEKWSKEKVQVIIATTAFGMGIDKPNVRFVIHFNLPKAVDSFYQESGRAGRDGAPSESILLFSFEDIFKASVMTFTEKNGVNNLYKMVEYSTSTLRCRRGFLADYFGSNWGGEVKCERHCDVCDGSLVAQELEVGLVAKEIINTLRRGEEEDVKITACKLLDALLGKGGGSKSVSRSVKLPKPWNRVNTSLVITQLLLDGLIKETFHFTPYSTISYLKLNNGFTHKAQQYSKISILSPLRDNDDEVICL